MITVVIKDDGEANVIQLTYENLWKELKDIEGAELLVEENWLDAIEKTKNTYICFVEADCLVSSGFFASQLGLFKKNPYFRKLAMMSSATGVNNWANRVYGYSISNVYSSGVVPNLVKSSNVIYPIQIGFVPGSIIRLKMFKAALTFLGIKKNTDDLVHFSTRISLAFWNQGDGNRVHLNPNTTYVTTEDYVNDVCKSSFVDPGLKTKFEREHIA